MRDETGDATAVPEVRARTNGEDRNDHKKVSVHIGTAGFLENTNGLSRPGLRLPVAAMTRLMNQITQQALTEDVSLRDRVTALGVLAEASLAISHLKTKTAVPKVRPPATIALGAPPSNVATVLPPAQDAAKIPPGVTDAGVPWPRTTVVIPTLNEAENIRLLLPRLPSWLHEVIIVDGRSVDGTPQVALEVYPSAKIVMETRAGKGAALRRGFAEATGDIIVMLDADGSMDPNEIYSFVGALMSGADMAKGTRFASGSGTDDMSLFRMLGNWGLTRFVMLLFSARFSDLCYGYMAFWSKWRPQLDSQSNGFEIETMLVLRALQARMRIVEVASFEHPRIHGESNLRALPDGIRILRTILAERFMRVRGRPSHA